MDLLKAQFAKISEQLGGLTATQKMLAGSLVAIMVLTMMLWARYASNADMVPVLDEAFNNEQITRATMLFKAEGIDYKVVGDRVQVSSDRQSQALAVLGYNQLLPSDSKSGFDDIISKTNPFDQKDKNDLMFNRAKSAELAQIISGFPGVGDAHVVVNQVLTRTIGAELKPSAVVTLRTRDAANVKQLIESAASTVASATSGLERSRVSVVIDGQTHRVHDGDGSTGAVGDEVYDRIQQEEQHYQDKIAGYLANYANPLITVSVDMEMQSSQSWKTSYDPKTTVSKETEIQSKTEESNQSQPQGDVGVAPNTQMSVNTPSAGGGTSTSTEDNTTKLETRFGSTTESILKPAGHATVVAAAVALPRSHFLELYKAQNKSAQEVDDNTLRTFAATELTSVKNSVMAACAMATTDKIFVDFYADAPQSGGGTTGDVALAGASTTGVAVTAHLKEIAIGVLAMVSLFMVSMMVKKGAPAPAVVMAPSEPEEPLGPSFVGGDDEVSGIVGSGVNALDGMELDDESLKAQQMVEQVTTMVQENPDAAATLVKRWLNRG